MPSRSPDDAPGQQLPLLDDTFRRPILAQFRALLRLFLRDCGVQCLACMRSPCPCAACVSRCNGRFKFSVDCLWRRRRLQLGRRCPYRFRRHSARARAKTRCATVVGSDHRTDWSTAETHAPARRPVSLIPFDFSPAPRQARPEFMITLERSCSEGGSTPTSENDASLAWLERLPSPCVSSCGSRRLSTATCRR